ncbi:hypothetical protein T03_11195 [Trichinella britovi]|uniref:Uncharacterized protein n=1 Tax=Trichinella britovi TaxID=45882 RepID=A0A0V1D3H6_TRIBR|nr:hypothetical protein T03_11195 [Trichinella britovi]
MDEERLLRVSGRIARANFSDKACVTHCVIHQCGMCDGRSDVNHWMKSTKASETITQKHSDAYRSSWGVTITTRLALKQSLSTTSIANLHNCL